MCIRDSIPGDLWQAGQRHVTTGLFFDLRRLEVITNEAEVTEEAVCAAMSLPRDVTPRRQKGEPAPLFHEDIPLERWMALWDALRDTMLVELRQAMPRKGTIMKKSTQSKIKDARNSVMKAIGKLYPFEVDFKTFCNPFINLTNFRKCRLRSRKVIDENRIRLTNFCFNTNAKKQL